MRRLDRVNAVLLFLFAVASGFAVYFFTHYDVLLYARHYPTDPNVVRLGLALLAVLVIAGIGVIANRDEPPPMRLTRRWLPMLSLLFVAVSLQAQVPADDGWRPAPSSSAGDDSWLRPAAYLPTCTEDHARGVDLTAFYTLRGHVIPLWLGNNWPEHMSLRLPWIHRFDRAGHEVGRPVATADWLPCMQISAHPAFYTQPPKVTAFVHHE